MSDPRKEATGRVVDAMFVLAKQATAYGLEHPATMSGVSTLRDKIIEADPPFSLQFMEFGMFRNVGLVPLDLERFQRGLFLYKMFSAAGANELQFSGDPQASDLMELFRAALDPRERRLEQMALESLRCDTVEGLSVGVGGSLVDRESFAIAQITLAIQGAERLVGAGPWDRSQALTVLRRIERAQSIHPSAASRAVELAPTEWSVARRAVGAGLLAQALLNDVGATSGSKRATAHAALIMACSGYQSRSGVPTRQAADLAFERLVGRLETDGVELPPHDILVSSLLREVAGGHFKERGLSALLALTYEAEKLRSPEGVDFDLTKMDVLAQLVESPPKGVDPGWVHLLVSSSRALPPGARVKLADGRIGLVMGPGAPMDPNRPEVLIGGVRFIPDDPVTLDTRPSRRARAERR